MGSAGKAVLWMVAPFTEKVAVRTSVSLLAVTVIKRLDLSAPINTSAVTLPWRRSSWFDGLTVALLSAEIVTGMPVMTLRSASTAVTVTLTTSPPELPTLVRSSSNVMSLARALSARDPPRQS